MIEVELAAEHLPGHLLGLLRVVDLLRRHGDEAAEVPHAEEPGDELVGVERLQVADVLAGSDEDDPGVGLGDRRDRPSSLGGSVHLREDDTCDAHSVVERLRLGTGLLSDLRVEDQDPLLGLGHIRDPLDLVDEVVLQGVPTGGVDDDHLLVLEAFESVLDDERGIGLSGFAVDLHAHLLAELPELVESRGPVDVCADESDREALLREVHGELACGGGLTLTVQSDHHDGLRLHGDAGGVAVDHPDELVAYDLDHMVLHAPAGVRRLVECAVLHPVGDLEDQLDVDVGFQKRTLEVLAYVLDEFVVHRRGAAYAPEDSPQGFAQSFQDHG